MTGGRSRGAYAVQFTRGNGGRLMARCWAGKANTGDSRHRCPAPAQPGKVLCIACEQAGLARVRERLVARVQPWRETSSAVRRVLVGRVNA